jgi:hypothetical protein
VFGHRWEGRGRGRRKLQQQRILCARLLPAHACAAGLQPQADSDGAQLAKLRVAPLDRQAQYAMIERDRALQV